jgi:hypothetical protein
MAATIPSSPVSSQTGLYPMQSLPQANLASSFSNLDLSTFYEDNILSQFYTFLASKGGSWQGKSPS